MGHGGCSIPYPLGNALDLVPSGRDHPAFVCDLRGQRPCLIHPRRAQQKRNTGRNDGEQSGPYPPHLKMAPKKSEAPTPPWSDAVLRRPRRRRTQAGGRAEAGKWRKYPKPKEEESAGGTKGSSKKASAAQLRIQKDINELNLPKTCDISFSDPDDLLNFKLVICPDEGFYKSGKFVFSFKVGQGYPHDPPKVKCETMVYHPNIDLEGNVCLNILREDWKPVLTINSIIYGLQYLFLEPNPEDPLNKEAAEVLQNNRRLFEQNVQRSMRGGYIGSTYFERCLK
ncbi:NEDD8-conjugating enzyme Ubc12 [Carlito syrichta]|uniref:NEDD8-conjugating enzyme UBC12 n=1 Tax=Carlito syrichta TaxID=1868482 RepID=A0A3Q0DQH7_CARSF|nr:NEDD8-conjugating enzyme Ubc12 [Carlito syrichta]